VGQGLLERAAALELLASVLTAASEGRGSVVLLGGEAGIGKSSVVRAFTAAIGRRARVLVGGCDDLVTPRTLGALRDAFAGHAPRLERLLAEGARDDVFTAVLAELTDPARPTVLVIEDVHWADDATLDVLRYVCRRIGGSSAVVVVSYRDDEVGRDHPAHRLLGGLGGVPVQRLVLPRLSPAAVATLADGSVAASAELHRLTGGNPFFVTEVVASVGGLDGDVPPTVVDAVLARVRQLARPVQSALEVLAVVPTRVELSLARALLGDLTVLAEAERRGVLEVRPDAVAFRHELARRALELSLPVSERMHAHAKVVEILAARGEPDLPRILHHAVEAADDPRVVELAPRAAARAAHAGSYAQEITCHRLLLERAPFLGTAELADVRQRLAVALWLSDAPTESLEHGREAVRLQEELGDVAAIGEALSVIVPVQWVLARTHDALADSHRAIELLDSVGESTARTFALIYHALLLGVMGHEDVLPAAERADAAARRTGPPELAGLGQACLGRARMLVGDVDEGLGLMESGLVATRAVNAHTSALIVNALLVQDSFDLARFDECQRYADEAIAYADECEVWYLIRTLGALSLRLRAVRGEWDEAIAGLRAIEATGTGPDAGPLRYVLAPLARLLARRGSDEAPAFLARARAFARRADCYYDWRHSGLVEIETAWLTGRHADADEAIARLDELTDRPGRETARAELHRWKRRLGLPHEVPPGCPEVLAAGIRGDWRAAAAGWEALGAPYHRALELIDADEVEAVRDGLQVLDDLGAQPAARRARQRLRTLGVTHIPRGPRSATRANPAGLSPRQVEVLRLLAEGLTNAELAARLVISEKTADHHVSAVLTKLAVRTRREAAAVARNLGLAPDRRRAPRERPDPP
jgi:DNA-binding CsgD family transcriptional regulator